MPTQTIFPKLSQDRIIKPPADRFADFHSLLTFPKDFITSKMIPISNQNETFLVSCLKNGPLVIVKDYKLIRPIYQKVDLFPLKPIQRLSSFAEFEGSLLLSHGDHSLEMDKLCAGGDGGFVISRFCQKTVEKTYKKILFASSSSFYGKNDTQIDYLDIKRLSRITNIDSRNIICDFDICPFEPSIISYTNEYLNIKDIRTGSDSDLLFKHKNRSNLIQWNPNVPYWFATSTSTHLNIFDIRYNSPFPVLRIQHANIHELCWSPSNCDLILAASRDRRTNLWSLRHSENNCRLSMTMNRFDLGSLTAGSSNLFYGLDDADSLIKIKIRSEYLTNIAPESSSEYKEIQDAIYSADYDIFKAKLTEMSQEAFNNSNYSKLKQLILLTMPVKPKTAKFDEKIISSIEIDGKFEEFRESLITSSKSSKLNLNLNGTEVQNFIDMLRLKIRVIELMSSGDFEAFKKFTKLITRAICDDLNFLDQNESVKLMAFLLKNDRRCALEVLIEISSSFPIGIPKVLQIWLWMACYPTIFDPKSFEIIKIRPSLSKSIDNLELDDELKVENFLEKQRNQILLSLFVSPQDLGAQNMKIIHQIYLNLCNSGNPAGNMEKTLKTELLLLSNNLNLEEIQEDLLQENNSIFLISSQVIKNLLEKSFRSTSKTFLTDFFLISYRLEVLTYKTPINSGIMDLVTNMGFSRLKFLLSSLSSINNNHIAAINSIITIGTDCYCTLSEDQLNFLGERLHYFMGKLDKEDLSLIDNKNFLIDNEKIKSNNFKLELRNLKKMIQ